MKCPNCGAEVRGKYCEYCGSELSGEKTTIHITNNYYYSGTGEQQENNAQAPTQNKAKGKKKRTWLWVLGWICIFPLPLTILLLRKKNMKPIVKYGLIAIAWLLFISIGTEESPETDIPQNDTSSYVESTQAAQEPTDEVLTDIVYAEDEAE